MFVYNLNANYRNLLDTEDQNLFFVDWGMKNKAYIYKTARSRVNEIAKVVARFIEFLHENAGLKYDMVTIIGFSLGAHIAGIAGKDLIDIKLKKIVGLDPAGPLFDARDVDNRLSPDSASYTECLHTGYVFGIREPICQTDFYINSGSKQPGCKITEGIDFAPCSHLRVIDIYIESLGNPKGFYGDRCPDLDGALNMNCNERPGAFINDPENESKNISGIFQVITSAQTPFAQGRVDN